MTVPFQAHGAHTAIATPFHEDGSLDVKAFERLVAFQAGEGITGIVPGGTTGESPTLTWEEHATLVERTLAIAKGVSVLAGTGSNSTDEAIDASKQARDRGATVIAVSGLSGGPLAQVADIRLHTVADEERVRSSAITARDAQLMLTDLLFILLVQRQSDANEYVQKSEQAVSVLKTR